jgi:hypothetical protein
MKFFYGLEARSSVTATREGLFYFGVVTIIYLFHYIYYYCCIYFYVRACLTLSEHEHAGGL